MSNTTTNDDDEKDKTPPTEPPPHGIFPFFMSNTAAEKSSLKTGPNIIDLVPFKRFNRPATLEEIKKYGFMCAFEPCEKILKGPDYSSSPTTTTNDNDGDEQQQQQQPEEEDEFLIVCDPTRRYGELFLLYHDKNAIEDFERELAAAVELKRETERKEEEERKRIEEERIARATAVYVEQPVMVGVYESDSAKESENEVRMLGIRSDEEGRRDLISFMVSRVDNNRADNTVRSGDGDGIEPRRYDNRDDEAFSTNTIGWGMSKDDNVDDDDNERRQQRIMWKLMKRDVGVQAAPTRSSGIAQTIGNRSVNKTTQYQVNRTSLGPNISNNGSKQNLSDSLSRLLPLVELALQENETVDVFASGLNASSSSFYKSHSINVDDDDDDDNMSTETARDDNNNHNDDFGSSTPRANATTTTTKTTETAATTTTTTPSSIRLFDPESKNQLKEYRNFTDLEYSRGRIVKCIDWHPYRNDVVASSVCRNASFDERVAVAGYGDDAFVILWEFSEWIHPLMVLRSPFDCMTFGFNPTDPDVIVAGCINGQVILWDVKRRRREQQKQQRDNNNAEGDVDDDEMVKKNNKTPLEACALSHPEKSHKRMITNLIWLPADIQINYKGQILSRDYISSRTHQFVTVSSDGQVFFWDMRFEDIAMGKLSHVAKAKLNKRDNTNSSSSESAGAKHSSNNNGETSSVPWDPIFRIKTKRLEGTGEVSLCQMIPSDLPSRNRKHEALRTQFICSSEEGDILGIDMIPKQKGNGTTEDKQQQKNSNDAEITEEPEYVQWMSPDHTRPCLALAQSPFFPSIIASVSDFYFHIWNVDNNDDNDDSGGDPKKTAKPADKKSTASLQDQQQPQIRHPILSSPRTTTHHFTGGRWSPTRPAVFFASKTDGSIDVWDYTDSSYGPTVTVTTTPSSIMCMTFLTTDNNNSSSGNNNKNNNTRHDEDGSYDEEKTTDGYDNDDNNKNKRRHQRHRHSQQQQQLLAIGDSLGSLHIFEMPKNLSRPIANEKKIVAQFWEREIILSSRHGLENDDKTTTSENNHSDNMHDHQAAMTSPNKKQIKQQQLSSSSSSKQDNGSILITNNDDDDVDLTTMLENDEREYMEIERQFMKDLGLEVPDDEDGVEKGNTTIASQ